MTDDDDKKTKGPQRQAKTTKRFFIPALGTISFSTSRKKRREIIALFFISLYFYLPAAILIWVWLFYTFFISNSMLLKGLHVLYLTYSFVWHRNTPKDGSSSTYLRNVRWIWSHACDYFPITLIKTAELDPNKSYVMGYHPHGIISVGALGAFGTDAARTKSLVKDKQNNDDGDNDKDDGVVTRGFSSLYPGIDRRLVTLPVQFNTPFLRDYVMSLSGCDSSPETFQKVLRRNGGKGNALVVVVGGASESMLVKPGTMDLVLKTRRGFVREAIKANASLVPILAFGENDLYHVIDTEKYHWIHTIQSFVKQMTGVGTLFCLYLFVNICKLARRNSL